MKSAIDALQAGKMVILTDRTDRENEGDLVFPAETITPEIINFMIRHGTGIVCLALTPDQVDQAGLPMMVPPAHNTCQRHTTFTVSIDAKTGISTGVSAADRAHTIRVALGKQAGDHLSMPGHVFPLQARQNGVLERDGHTEGSIDLVRLAGFQPAAVICELMNPDGSMMQGAQLSAFAAEHDIALLSIADIIDHRLRHENLISEEVSAQLPTANYGDFEITVVREKLQGKEHVMLYRPPVEPDKPVLTRIHSACFTGDLFGSLRCDCEAQLHHALERMALEGGVLIYLNQEGRNIGLFNKIKTYALQEEGLDTIDANLHLNLPADARQYYLAANMLRNKGITAVRLLTNNPHKLAELQHYGIDAQHEAMPTFCHDDNRKYLTTKKNRMHHLMSLMNHDMNL